MLYNFNLINKNVWADFDFNQYYFKEHYFLNIFINKHHYIIIRCRINSKNLTIKNFRCKRAIGFNFKQIIELVCGSNLFINFSFNSRIKIINKGKIKY
jgi:hypothetical protein